MSDLAPDSAAEQLAPLALPIVTRDQAALLKVKTLLALAAWYRDQDELAAAKIVLEAAAGGSSSHQLVQEQAALTQAAGDPDAALVLLQRDAEERQTMTAWTNVARLLLEMGDLDGAQAIVDRQQAANPSALTIKHFLAELALAAGDTDRARQLYETTLAETPDSQTAHLGLARIALETGDRVTADAELDAALAAAAERGGTPNEFMIALATLLSRPALAGQLRASRRRAERQRVARLAALLVEELGSDVIVLPPSDRVSTDPPPIDRDTWSPSPEDEFGPGQGQDPITPGVPAGEGEAPPDISREPELEAALDPRVLEVLQSEYGYSTLRDGQAAVIANALAGIDTLAIMPTGAGKSLTFQIPALLGSGVTLVISPLIALMKDQFDSLPAGLKAQSAMLNSSQSSEEQRAVLTALRRGELKLIYAAPERLRQHSFVRELRQAGVSLVVVDEAHCISLWGHDFRPDYLTIPTILADLGEPTLLAVTATATRKMADDIKARFGRNLTEIRTSVYRPNLRYEAQLHGKREQKIAQAIAIAREEKGTGIIYARSRRDTESIAQLLRDRGVSAVAYHAGLDSGIRSQNQERFMSGAARVIVATTAFGMGVNKANVRFIVHLSPPNSLEAYSQESGRAGRDGERARCILLATKADRTTLTTMAKRDLLSVEDLRRLYQGLMQAATGSWVIASPGSLNRWQPGDDDDDAADPRVGINLLEQARLLRRYADQPINYTVPYELGPAIDPDTAGDWAEFIAWYQRQGGDSLVRTAAVLDGLQWTPERLARALTANLPHGLREGPREGCFELLPAGPNARGRIEQVLAEVSRQTTDRIAQVMAYVNATRCRHQILAQHLGEALAPCGENCDICHPDSGARVTAVPAPPAKERATPTAADAMEVLNAMSSLGFNLGKPGWVKLLTGSVESRVRADRTEYFGRLQDLKKSAIERTLDTLAEGGLIEAYIDRDFRLYRQTSAGRTATEDDLTRLFPHRARATSTATAARGDHRALREDSATFTVDDEELFQELRAWRAEQASVNGAPAYTVAPDAALEAVAAARPRTRNELGAIGGFGPSRVEKYGDAILGIVAGATGQNAADVSAPASRSATSEGAQRRSGRRPEQRSASAGAQRGGAPASRGQLAPDDGGEASAWDALGAARIDDYDDGAIDPRWDSGYFEDEPDEYQDLPPEPGEPVGYGFHVERPYE